MYLYHLTHYNCPNYPQHTLKQWRALHYYELFCYLYTFLFILSQQSSPKQPAVDEDDDHHLQMEQIDVSGTKLADFFPTLTATSNFVDGPCRPHLVSMTRKQAEKGIDASHAILPDRKSQGGACIGLGRGRIHASTTSLKSYTQSSAETEFLATGDNVPDAIFIRNYLTHLSSRLNILNYR